MLPLVFWLFHHWALLGGVDALVRGWCSLFWFVPAPLLWLVSLTQTYKLYKTLFSFFHSKQLYKEFISCLAVPLSSLSDPCPLGSSLGPTGSLGRCFAPEEEEITICFNLLVNCFSNCFFSWAWSYFVFTKKNLWYFSSIFITIIWFGYSFGLCNDAFLILITSFSLLCHHAAFLLSFLKISLMGSIHCGSSFTSFSSLHTA